MAGGRWRTVSQGVSIETLAFEHGLLWTTLADHPENAHLSENGRSPHVLEPGDRVFIPELAPKWVDAATDASHRFRVKGIPSHFRMKFFLDGQPRANAECTVLVDELEEEHATDGDGLLDITIPVKTQRIEVRFDPVPQDEPPVDTSFDDDPAPEEPEDEAPDVKDVYVFDLRHLDPTSSHVGAQARLRAMGYDVGALDGELGPRTVDALLSYQEDSGLEPTGELDEATLAELQKLVPG